MPTYAERKHPPAARLDSNGFDLSHKIVAILDDDEDVLRATAMSFDALGANVFTSSDSLHFLASLSSMPKTPDLVLLDYCLGAATVERTLAVLQTRFGSGLRAIVVSGHTTDARLRAMQAQVPVLAKPLTAANMRMIVEFVRGRSGLE
jgi:DNA-binding NtrC family response regulator